MTDENERTREPKLETSPPRGMRDILPDEAAVRDWAMSLILDVYRRHGFVRIETPAVESLRLLNRSEGGENEKLIYKILKRGEKLAAAQAPEDMADLGLRFDLTVPLARYYAQNHSRLPTPLKAIQIGPVWRAERPQQGRYRQFTQCDIDILGVASEIAEVELILATTEALLGFGLGGLTVRINDRRVLAAIAAHCGFDDGRHDSVFITLDKLDKMGREGVTAELREAGHPERAIARLLDLLASVGRAPSSVALDSLAGVLGDHADHAVWTALDRIMTTVHEHAGERIAIEFDPTLARGMGYYTGPIFEVRYQDSPSSIAGGGRYDRMIGKLLGREVPATGFSIGFERLVLLLMEQKGAGRPGEAVALVFDQEAAPLGRVLGHARDLREKGHVVLLELRSRKLGKQLQDLEGRGFRRIGVVAADGSVDWKGSDAPGGGR